MPGYASKLVSTIASALTPKSPLVGELNPVSPDQRSVINKVIGDRARGRRFDPDALKDLAAEYKINMGLDKLGDVSSAALDKYLSDRVQSVQDLKNSKTPEGELIAQKLTKAKENTKLQKAATKVTDALNEVFKPTAEFNAAQAEYMDATSQFRSYVESIPKTHRNAADLYGLLKETTDLGLKSIEQQQKEERTRMDKFLESHNTELMESLSINSTQLEAVKKSIKNDLEETHKTRLEAFKKSTQDSIRELMQTSAKQMKERLLMANFHSNDPEMQKIIETMADQNRKKLGEDLHTTVDLSENKVDIFSVKLEQLEFIRLIGGGKITPQKDPQTGETTYKLEMGMRVTNPWYYFGNKDKTDLMALAQTIRASGSQSIIMNLKFENPNIAQKRARDAYEACIKSGFPPDKITIQVNGQYYTAKEMDKTINGSVVKTKSIQSELYGKYGKEFQLLQEQSDTIRKQLDEITEFKPISAEKQAELKQDFQSFREQQAKETKKVSELQVNREATNEETPSAVSPS